jgi:hypothetical protein
MPWFLLCEENSRPLCRLEKHSRIIFAKVSGSTPCGSLDRVEVPARRFAAWLKSHFGQLVRPTPARISIAFRTATDLGRSVAGPGNLASGNHPRGSPLGNEGGKPSGCPLWALGGANHPFRPAFRRAAVTLPERSKGAVDGVQPAEGLWRQKSEIAYKMKGLQSVNGDSPRSTSSNPSPERIDEMFRGESPLVDENSGFDRISYGS